ncbi:DUF2442 domain-containing protein [Pseudoduganella sp. GCM10020061]|uniref:DUF2442 domain-containing protein n=1 Tax=Pseudoduganella sp. GCM10020061 TaxID=3317345 RepID=UPI00363FF942
MRHIPVQSAEVTTISPHGFWVGAGGEELYIAFHEYPDFEHATIREISRIEMLSATRLYWPCLGIDIDLSLLRCYASAA